MNYLIMFFILFAASVHAPSLKAKGLFQENFDVQKNYVSDHPTTFISSEPSPGTKIGIIPDNWDVIRQGSSWGQESIEIHTDHVDKAKGGTGKSLVLHRESIDKGPSTWTSEGLVMKHLPAGYDEMYVSFYIQFDPKWSDAAGWTTKMFRIYSWNTIDPITKFFGGGGSGPIALWDYEVSAYGLRNRWSFRGGPHGDNYSMGNISDFPKTLNGAGDASLNYTAHTVGQGVNGKTPQIPDLVNGGYISDNLNQTVGHDQIYGPGGTWTKIAFYVKMNSAPGVADGKMKQWLNDELILQSNKIPWTGPTSSPMPKWNVVAFGGNSYFAPFPDAEQYEEWYSIDDIYIADSIPGALADPKPPIPIP